MYTHVLTEMAYPYTQASVIHGHHVYKHVWTPTIGEELTLQQERNNRNDFYAVTAKKDAMVVGRVPRELPRAYWNCIQQGGHITCEVTAKRRKGRGWRYHASTSFVERKA